VNGRNFTPSVIEPSFGIGRIMYCMAGNECTMGVNVMHRICKLTLVL
jgi:glycyl-tRNA synthetase (class II)